MASSGRASTGKQWDDDVDQETMEVGDEADQDKEHDGGGGGREAEEEGGQGGMRGGGGGLAKRHRRQGRSCKWCNASVGEDDRRLSPDMSSWDYACRSCLGKRPQLKASPEKQGVGVMSVGAGEQEGGGAREEEGAASPATAPLPTKRPRRRAPKGKTLHGTGNEEEEDDDDDEDEEGQGTCVGVEGGHSRAGEVSAPLLSERQRVARAMKQEGLTQKQVRVRTFTHALPVSVCLRLRRASFFSSSLPLSASLHLSLKLNRPCLLLLPSSSHPPPPPPSPSRSISSTGGLQVRTPPQDGPQVTTRGARVCWDRGE